MTKRLRRLCAAAALALLAVAVAPVLAAATAPVQASGAPCPPGTEPFAEYRLFFGRGQGDVEAVSDAAWRAFLAEEVTPRFPDGLTVLDAAGQWREGSGAIVRERTKLPLVLARPGEAVLRRTDEIAEAYKRAFGQSSVLRVVTTACASF